MNAFTSALFLPHTDLDLFPSVVEKVKAKPQPPVWLDDAPWAVGHPNEDDLKNLRSSLAAAIK